MSYTEQIDDFLWELGLEWPDVWRAAVDRREGLIQVIAADGRKFSKPLLPERPKAGTAQPAGRPKSRAGAAR